MKAWLPSTIKVQDGEGTTYESSIYDETEYCGFDADFTQRQTWILRTIIDFSSQLACHRTDASHGLLRLWTGCVNLDRCVLPTRQCAKKARELACLRMCLLFMVFTVFIIEA